MTFPRSISARRFNRKFQQSQLNEWRLAHKRWSEEKFRLIERAEKAERERDLYRLALVEINKLGAVCMDFELCDHLSCRDSCAAKLTALAALESANLEDHEPKPS